MLILCLHSKFRFVVNISLKASIKNSRNKQIWPAVFSTVCDENFHTQRRAPTTRPIPPPNSYFSHKWLKMLLPTPAVHSFNPGRHLVESSCRINSLSSKTFIKDFTLLFARFVCKVSNKATGTEIVLYCDVFQRLLNIQREWVILFKHEKELCQNQLVKTSSNFTSQRNREKWLKGLKQDWTKTRAMGCGCADWSKLSTRTTTQDKTSASPLMFWVSWHMFAAQ